MSALGLPMFVADSRVCSTSGGVQIGCGFELTQDEPDQEVQPLIVWLCEFGVLSGPFALSGAF